MFQTDDDANRLQFIWKGDKSLPMPVDARGVMWVLGALVAAALITPLYMVIPDAAFSWLIFPVPITKGLAAVSLDLTLTVLFVRWFGKKVTPTTPVKHHVFTLAKEVSTPRPPKAQPYASSTIPDDFFIEEAPGTFIYSPAASIWKD